LQFFHGLQTLAKQYTRQVITTAVQKLLKLTETFSLYITLHLFVSDKAHSKLHVHGYTMKNKIKIKSEIKKN